MKPLRNLVRRIRGQHSLDEELISLSLREAYRQKGVTVGLYSYGCFDLQRVPAGVTIGRYCSFAPTSQIFLRNHGINFLGLTAYFYNSTLGAVSKDTIETQSLSIGDDVWLGHNSVILSGVGSIGRGAVIAAGAVVTKAVPAYAIAAGNPARIIKMRFDEDIIAKIEETRWWEMPLDQLKQLIRTNPDLAFNPELYFNDQMDKG